MLGIDVQKHIIMLLFVSLVGTLRALLISAFFDVSMDVTLVDSVINGNSFICIVPGKLRRAGGLQEHSIKNVHGCKL